MYKLILFFPLFLLISCQQPQPDNTAQTQGQTEVTQQLENLPPPQFSYEPGKRVGPIVAGMTMEEARRVVGKENLVFGELDGPEGTTLDGYLLYPGTPQEARIIPAPEGANWAFMLEIFREGSPWVSKTGLKLGTSLEELKSLNGGPFTFLGFGWDFGGIVTDWRGGKLEGHQATLSYSGDPSSVADEVLGDREVSSDDAALEALEVEVQHMGMTF